MIELDPGIAILLIVVVFVCGALSGAMVEQLLQDRDDRH